MVVFPEFVFAHAVLELKLALDDYLLMGQGWVALYHLGWNIQVGRGARFVHKLLTGPVLLWRFTTPSIKKRTPPSGTNPMSDLEANPVAETGKASTNDGSSLAHLSEGLRRSANNEIRGLYRLPVWTLTHCYFANMGGIKTIPPGSNVNLSDVRKHALVVTGDYLAMTLTSAVPEKQDIIGAIRMTEAEILDKSKADTFIRIFWLWEIARLVIEIITRASRLYPITQLEIITLSFAAISLATVLLQVKKPKDVGESMHFHYDYRGHVGTASLCNTFLKGRGVLGRFGYSIPNDYYRITEENEALFLAMLSLSTVAFGFIHCGAWNFTFPSTTEKWIWRGCALAGIVMPLIMLLVTLLFRLRNQKLLRECIRTFEQCNDTMRKVDQMCGEVWPTDESTQSRLRYYVDKIEESSRHGPVNDELATAVTGLTREWDTYIETLHAYTYWSNTSVRAQMPGLVIYFLTRFAIIGVAFTCFRSAPRGIYWGTWANFLPAFR